MVLRAMLKLHKEYIGDKQPIGQFQNSVLPNTLPSFRIIVGENFLDQRTIVVFNESAVLLNYTLLYIL